MEKPVTPILIIKKCCGLLCARISKFINSFLNIGIFPDVLKKGCITSIFKKGDFRYLDNYRPVSAVPIFSKIYEKLLYNRLYSFFAANNIIYNKQFGFRRNHSTSHAVNYAVHRILSEIENRNHVIGIFIDLSKAFDTIAHNTFLNKLKHYGIRGRCYQILNSHLTKRKQQPKFLYTRYPIVARALGLAAVQPLGRVRARAKESIAYKQNLKLTFLMNVILNMVYHKDQLLALCYS